MALILDPSKRWECPSCHHRHITHEPRPHVPMHPCPALHGLTAPYVELTGDELDPRAQRHRLVERDDYVGDEVVQTDSRGRPVMALITDRADGSNDCTVYLGTATGTGTANP